MGDIEMTIVIPMYNNEKHVKLTIDSLKNQTSQAWQCIVIDDESSDNSLSVAHSCIRGDKRFKVLKRKDFSETKGGNVCRNIGLNRTLSDFVMFVDADDYLHNDCVHSRIKTIQNYSDYDFYIFKTAFVNDDGVITGYFYNPNSHIPDILLRFVEHKIPWHTMSPVWNVNYLKSVGGWNEDYERLQDVELNIRVLLKKPSIYFASSDIDSFYRSNEMTHKKRLNARLGFCRLIKDYYNLLSYSTQLGQVSKDRIHDVFQGILEEQLANYILHRHNTHDIEDENWKHIYMETLKVLDVDERNEVARIFNRDTQITY